MTFLKSPDSLTCKWRFWTECMWFRIGANGELLLGQGVLFPHRNHSYVFRADGIWFRSIGFTVCCTRIKNGRATHRYSRSWRWFVRPVSCLPSLLAFACPDPRGSQFGAKRGNRDYSAARWWCHQIGDRTTDTRLTVTVTLLSRNTSCKERENSDIDRFQLTPCNSLSWEADSSSGGKDISFIILKTEILLPYPKQHATCL
jgi:hypothetical protein